MPKINDMVWIIDPEFIREEAHISGGGQITISGDYDISSIGLVEVPFVDGTVGLFNKKGEFLGLK